MNWLETQTLLLNATSSVVSFAIDWWLQSALLITVGLGIAALLRRRGSAVQSAIYRTTLVAVLLCPIASSVLSRAGFSGWSLAMPAAYQHVSTAAPVSRTVPSEPVPQAGEAMFNVAVAGSGPAEPGANPAFAEESERIALDPRLHNHPQSDQLPVITEPVAENIPAAMPVSAVETVAPRIISLAVRPFGAAAMAFSTIWLVMSFVLCTRLLRAWSHVAHLRSGAVAAEPAIIAMCGKLASALGATTPQVLRTPLIPSPCLTGLRRPSILLPDDEWQVPLRDVFVHELAHLLRRDLHWNLLQQVALAVFFFQPLLWSLARRLEATAEEVCDDYVVQYGGNREQYANRLVDIAEFSLLPATAAGVGIVSLRSMLSRRVARIMDSSRSLSTRVGNLLLLLVILGGLVATSAVGLVGLSSEGPSAVAETPDVASENAADDADKTDADAVQEQLEYSGTVVDPDGKPVSGARLYLVYFVPEPTGLLTPDWQQFAVTDSQGDFQFTIGDDHFGPLAPARQWEPGSICAVADGYGFAWSQAALFETSGKQLRAMRDRLNEIPSDMRARVQRLLSRRGAPLRLVPDDEPIRGQVLDINGQPVAGATLTLFEAYAGDAGTLDAWLSATRLKEADFYSTRESTPYFMNGPQLRSLITPATTDKDGRFTLRGVGRERVVRLLLEGPGIQTDLVWARTQFGDTVKLLKEFRSPDLGTFVYYPSEFTYIAGPTKPVIGVVREHGSGKPIANATIKSQKLHGNPIHGWGQDYIRAVTDNAGRYELRGMPLGDDNMIAAIASEEQPYLSVSKSLAISADGEHAELDIALPRGLWAEGQATDRATGKSITGTVEYFYFPDNPYFQELGSVGNADERDRFRTDSQGRFRIPILPGRGIVTFSADDHEAYPRGIGAETIEGSNARSGELSFATEPHYCTPKNYHLLVEINPTRAESSVRLHLGLEAGKNLRGRLVDAAGKPVTTASYHGRLAEFSTWHPVSADGSFTVHNYHPDVPRRLMFADQERRLAAHLLLSGPASEDVTVTLQPAGTVRGRLVDEQGEPLPDMLLTAWRPVPVPVATASTGQPQPGPTPPPDRFGRSEYATDSEGRFEIAGLAPGVEYPLRAHGSQRAPVVPGSPPRPYGPLTKVIKVEEGEVLDVGDVGIVNQRENQPRQTSASTAARNVPSKNEAAKTNSRTARNESQKPSGAMTIKGRVTDEQGQPVAGADVAAIAWRNAASRGGDYRPAGVVLAEGVSDSSGNFSFTIKGVSSQTHRFPSLIARKQGLAVGWQKFGLDADEVMAELTLAPEQLIRGQLVDIEGQPASDVRLIARGIIQRSANGLPVEEGVGFHGEQVPAAWLPSVVSDPQGRFTVHGVPGDYGVFFDVEPDDRFAPQDIALNTGMPEEREERDRTYRSLVKNVQPDQEAVLVLSPAQVFKGVVTYADTGEPAPHARLSIWASQQEYGSMASVAGQADDKGRYRVIPKAGIRFGVTAYPPDGTPYLARKTPLSEAIHWAAGDREKEVDVALPRGVLVRGRVVEEQSGLPVSGASIQYIPEDLNNPHTSEQILTGWQGIVVADDQGNFVITVLPGPGRLLAHAPVNQYVLQQSSGRELSRGEAGGQRKYAHAIHKLDLAPDANTVEVTLTMKRSQVVRGEILDEEGKPIDEALVISRLNISPLSPDWRGHTNPTLGGSFQIGGLAEGDEVPVYFLDPKRRLGATRTIKGSNSEVKVTLLPCGQATLRCIDSEGAPAADIYPTIELVVTPGPHPLNRAEPGVLTADSDFISNVDRVNYWELIKTDADGKLTLPALIPGATYRAVTRTDGKFQIAKEFQVKPGETLDLGEMTVELQQ